MERDIRQLSDEVDRLTRKLGIEQFAGTSDLFTIDMSVDAEFYHRIFDVQFQRLVNNTSMFRISKPRKLDDSTKRTNVAALVQTLEYVGRRDDERQRIWLLDDKGNLTAPDPDEMQDLPGGLIIIYTQPRLLDKTPEPVSSMRTFRDTPAALQRKLVARRTAELHGEEASLAYVFALDHGTMTQFIPICIARAIAEGVSLPRDWKYRFTVAELGPPRLVFKIGELPHLLNFALGLRTVEFYGHALKDESQTACELRFRLSSIGVVDSDGIAESPLDCDRDDPAMAAPSPSRALRNPFLYQAQVLDVRDHGMRVRTVVDPTTREQIAIYEPRDDDDDGDGDEDDGASSVAPSLDSVFEYAERAQLEPEHRNFYAARLDTHEFSDRLYAMPRTTALIGRCFAEARPPEQLVERFTTLFMAVVVLMRNYCQLSMARFRAVDLFYLYQLATHEQRAAGMVATTSYATLSEKTRVACAKIAEDELALSEIEAPSGIESLVRQTLAASDDRRRVAEHVQWLFFTHELNRTIDAFQITRTRDERRARPTIVEMRRSNRAELDAFCEAHALVWHSERLDELALLTPHTNPYDVVLRFSAHDATPLRLLTSVRAYVPTARDGTDFLVVWAPQPFSIPRRVAADDGQTVLDVYLALRRDVWHRIACGALPQAVIEARSREAASACPKLPLMAPILNAAMRDENPDLQADAAAALQALSATARSVLPFASASGTELLQSVARAYSGYDMERRTADALPAATERRTLVTHVVDGLLAAGIAAAEAAKDPRRQAAGRHTLWTDSIFAAIHAALAGHRAYCGISKSAIDALTSRPAQSVRHGKFIEFCTELRGIACGVPTPTMAAANARYDLTELRCCCGAQSQHCEAMRAQLSVAQGAEEPEITQLVCCVCAHHSINRQTRPLGYRRKRALDAMGVTDTRCKWCARRDTIETRLIDESFVVVGYAKAKYDIVSELAAAGDVRALSALRLCRGGAMLGVPVPRNSTARRTRRSASSASVGDRTVYGRILAATRAALATDDAPEADEYQSIHDRHRLALIVALECAALVDHRTLFDLREKGDIDAIVALLSPLTDDEYMRAGDDTLVAHHEATVTWFPLCPSALAESGSVGAYGLQSIASDGRHSVHERAAALLFDGRMMRPFASAIPGIWMVFMDWYMQNMP